MKAQVKLMLPGFAGNMDDVVIYYNAHLNKYIARRKVMPKFTPSNEIVKEIYAFARRIELSDAYKADCREYIKLYNRKNRRKGRAMSTWPNVFMKVMRATKKQYPELDFKTLTREELVTMQLPCRNIVSSIEAGYLEKIPGYKELMSML
ncbi:MAG: hypothetical protein PHR32_04690 [Candidatus Cloacimonetes bacterium]|jgi:hypothetical protein|nr:hypothetical protein [Candidatus Cloacimonadota bacterium]